MTLFVVRHGETLWNREGRKQGRRDSPLTLRGLEQARAHAETLRGLRGLEWQLHTSPLFRARQTAAIIAETLELPPDRQFESILLAECDLGEFEGLTDAEVRERHPGALEARKRSKWSYVFPGGESYADVHLRMQRWLGEGRGETPAIVVTHGIASRALRGAYLGLEPDAILALDNHDQSRIYRLEGGRIEVVDG
ncbi:MAG: histidine phosphatase family protein [Proteobacteria bacterium]|nr:histidine phosphatase family protein [Pseudomonadota bacterium]